MQNIQPVLDKIYERIEAHKIDTGRYARWLWQDANNSRELGVNPYGCADAANLLYMLGHFPRVIDERSEWIEAMREMQDKESGLFYEKTHHPLHTTAHVTAALELFDKAPKHRPTAALPYLEEVIILSLKQNIIFLFPCHLKVGQGILFIYIVFLQTV